MKIDNLISPISNKNIFSISKQDEQIKDRLEKISEMSDNFKENDKYVIKIFKVEDNRSLDFKEDLNTNDLYLLKDFISSSNKNNSICLDKINELNVIKPDWDVDNSKHNIFRKDQIINQTRINLTPIAKQSDKRIIYKYKHLFEDVEEKNNPKSVRGLHGFKRFNKNEEIESDITSFRNNPSNFNITDISVNRISNINNMNIDALPNEKFNPDQEIAKETLQLEETTRNE